MTKVQIRFNLQKPLDEHMMARISDAHSIYGILRIRPDRESNRLAVEFDATRLRPGEVEAALAKAGIAVAPK